MISLFFPIFYRQGMLFPQTCFMLKASSIQEAFQMNQTAIGSYIARKREE